MADSAATAHRPPDSPELLLARYVGGDDGAFGALVARYEEKLYAFLVRMVGDEHLAEDVFQQTFVKVARSAAAYDGRAAFSTWLYRIARNTALDELRRRARRRGETGWTRGESVRDVADPSLRPPLEALAAAEQAELVREVLAGIPEMQREAFLLKEEGDLDFGRIGEILGCGRETAKSRFRLAVEKIRAAFGVAGGNVHEQ